MSKSYSERYEETSRLATEQIRSLVSGRKQQGKPTGVAERILAERAAGSEGQTRSGGSGPAPATGGYGSGAK